MKLSKIGTDIWQAGILHAPIAKLLDGAALRQVPITWLPEQPSYCFLADPFGVARAGQLHVFVEYYDYRDKHGVIHYYTYDRTFTLVDQGCALRAAHHVSYPQIIEDDGEIYMLPEAYRSGKLTLYRAKQFPRTWEPVCDLLTLPAIDASVIKHNEMWWMFYALPGAGNRAMRELHVASATKLTGPWTPHPQNPVRTALDSARPGGQPFVSDGRVYLPTQDCTDTYGGAVTLLRLDELSTTDVKASAQRHIVPTTINTPVSDGLHTLSACGDVTLFDVKRIDRSSIRILIDLQRRWRRLTGFGRSHA